VVFAVFSEAKVTHEHMFDGRDGIVHHVKYTRGHHQTRSNEDNHKEYLPVYSPFEAWRIVIFYALIAPQQRASKSY
jgi:hypothetical protein